MFYRPLQPCLRGKQSHSRRNIAANLISLEGKRHVRMELNAQLYADIVSPSGSFRLPLLGYPVWQCGRVIIQEFRTHRSALLMAAPAYTRRVHGGMHRLLAARARDGLTLFTHGHRRLSSGTAREKTWRIMSHNIAGIPANPRKLTHAYSSRRLACCEQSLVRLFRKRFTAVTRRHLANSCNEDIRDIREIQDVPGKAGPGSADEHGEIM